MITAALRSSQLEVVPAFNGRQALTAVGRTRFDLCLVDIGLPDMLGLDVIRRIRARGIPTPVVAITPLADVKMVVEAIGVGAVTVLEKPLSLDALNDAVTTILCLASGDRVARQQQPPVSASGECQLPAGRSVWNYDSSSPVERCAQSVLRAVDAERDPKTIAYWGRLVGVSSSVLRERCRLVHVSPHDARDFARVLRAICRSGKRWQPEVDLDVSDARTLKRLERRAGLVGVSQYGAPTVREFLDRQHLIAADSPVLRAIRRMLNMDDSAQGGNPDHPR